MAEYTGIAANLFREGEYRTEKELIIAIYLMVTRDMLGVAEARPHQVKHACKIKRTGAVIDALDYLESIEKLIFSVDKAYVWWRSGVYHSLYCGKGYSQQQLNHVQKLLQYWHYSGKFGQNFAQTVTQLYATKYEIIIPSIFASPRVSAESESETETKTETEGLSNNANCRTINPNRINEILNRPDLADPYKSLMEWDEKEGDALLQEFLCLPGYDHREWLLSQFEECAAYVKTEPAKVRTSLANKYDGKWAGYVAAWIRRGKTSGSLDRFIRRRGVKV